MSKENVAPTHSHDQISLATGANVTAKPGKTRRSSVRQASPEILTEREPRRLHERATSSTRKSHETHALLIPAAAKSTSRDVKKSYAYDQLTACLRDAGGQGILEDYDIDLLWTASKDPPITPRSLEELDFKNLKRCVHLRHNLNFDADIQFRRNDRGPNGSYRTQQAQMYWQALEIELALYQLYWEGLTTKFSSCESILRPPFPAPLSLHGVPLRLTQLIVTTRCIATSLLPPARHPALHAQLDPHLLVQEIDHGRFNLNSTIESVGMLLLDVCSPLRDGLIDSMISVISHGCEEDDPQIICLGIQELFCIMETMKLVS